MSDEGNAQLAEALEQLRSNDPRVRAEAAATLARLRHPQALEACLQSLNDAPDELHQDMTPAVEALSGMGLPAVLPLLGRLDDEDENTRLRAQRALEGIVNRQNGFVPGQGFPSSEAEARVRALWRDNGGYDAAGPPADRAASIRQWRRWLAEQGGPR